MLSGTRAFLSGKSGTLLVPREYGYVILVVVFFIFILVWKEIKVGQARKRFNVKYPTMYENKEDSHFNCYQRAHQNTLEKTPTFLVLMLLGGLYAPIFSSISGLIWCFGRIQYALGYYSGDPKKRMRGTFGYFGLLGLLGATIALALSLLKVI
ncbi:glutathione S-transferase [Galdieria sulphuraria]|uniref:Glutathione S-transferase 3, mitochondrial n=1 Tax=Galdieria sulphuraria TaxID=130081 RepID=M2XHP4_GALSU|nr:glutathione S-transferase [Galdieria sulphuraria]EME29607.1 glutathione S-transferase [Galdieria sulphuraria]|eukprot:XP_005706127.1 glutathione S-transferase [Galdieria sulphuraria]